MGRLNRVVPPRVESWEHHIHATIRRYEAIDQTRTSELVKKTEDSLLPSLSKLQGFNGYYLIDAGDGIISSVVAHRTRELVGA